VAGILAIGIAVGGADAVVRPAREDHSNRADYLVMPGRELATETECPQGAPHFGSLVGSMAGLVGGCGGP
jgi:hypothetical protein